jgi:hypothetical protein
MKFFKKKPNYLKEKSLQEAKDLGFLTEEEFLRLRYMRAEEDLVNYGKELKKLKPKK